MRLKPAISTDDAYHYLAAAGKIAWGERSVTLIDKDLWIIAEMMATLSELEIPQETEPLFGEDVALEEGAVL